MFEGLQGFAGGIGASFAAAAAGAAWIAAIAAPNVSYDRLDYSRADGHVRDLLKTASTPIAGLLLAATALGMLAFNWASAATAALAAVGFFTNRMTLAPKKKGEAPPGVRQKRKTQRVVAVSLSLIFTAVAIISAVLGVLAI